MMGKNMAPAAVLEINSVMKVPTKQIAVITTIGLSPQTSRIPKARRSAIPVFWMATPSTTEPANTIRISQLMAFIAWSTLQQRKSSIAIAARKAHCSSGIISRAESTTIAIMIVVEISVFLPMFGTWSLSKKCSFVVRLDSSIFSLGGQSSSSVSPAWRTTSRGDCWIRLPLRATATSTTPLSFSKLVEPIAFPIRLLSKVT